MSTASQRKSKARQLERKIDKLERRGVAIGCPDAFHGPKPDRKVCRTLNRKIKREYLKLFNVEGRNTLRKMGALSAAPKTAKKKRRTAAQRAQDALIKRRLAWLDREIHRKK